MPRQGLGQSIGAKRVRRAQRQQRRTAASLPIVGKPITGAKPRRVRRPALRPSRPVPHAPAQRPAQQTGQRPKPKVKFTKPGHAKSLADITAIHAARQALSKPGAIGIRLRTPGGGLRTYGTVPMALHAYTRMPGAKIEPVISTRKAAKLAEGKGSRGPLGAINDLSNFGTKAGQDLGKSITHLLGVRHGAGLQTAAAASPAPSLGVIAGAFPKQSAEVLGNAASDALALGSQAPASAYYLARDAATNPSKAIDEFTKPYRDLASNPGKFVHKHPLLTIALIRGAVGGVGGIAGKTGRTVGESAAMVGKHDFAKKFRWADTTRAPMKVPGTERVVSHRYSPNSADKAVQVLGENLGRRRAAKLRDQANALEVKRPHDAHAEVQRLRAQANKYDPGVPSGRQIRHATNVEEGQNLAGSAFARSKARHQAESAIKKIPRKERPAAHAILTNVARPTTEGIRNEVARLRAIHDHLPSATAKKNNEATVRELEKVAKHGVSTEKWARLAKTLHDTYGPLEQELIHRGWLPAEVAADAKVKAYAAVHMGGETVDRAGVSLPGIRRRDAKAAVSDEQLQRLGRAVSSAEYGDPASFKAIQDVYRAALERAYPRLNPGEIRAHMKASGHFAHEPFFVSARGASGSDFNATPVALKGPRTLRLGRGASRKSGQAEVKGTAPLGTEHVIAQHTRAALIAEDNMQWAEALKQNMAHNPHTGSEIRLPYKQADLVRKDLETRTGQRFRLVPETFLDRNAVRELHAAQQGSEAANTIYHNALMDALKGKERAGNFVLVPEEWAKRLQQHADVRAPAGTGRRAARTLQSVMTRNVLSTSPKYYAGNVLEGTLRSLLHRAGPRSNRFAASVKDAMEARHGERAAARLDAAVGQGGMAQSIVKRPYMGGGSKLIHGYNKITGAMLEGASRGTEIPFTRTIGGKEYLKLFHEMRRAGQITGRAFSQDNLGAIADHLNAHPEEIVRINQAVRRAYGTYSHMSPAARAWTMYATPFAPWVVNSFFLIYRVLPVDHPVVLAMLATAVAATEDYRKTIGQDPRFFGAGTMPGDPKQVPSWLMGAAHKSDGWFPSQQLTPAGAVGGAPQNIPSLLFPAESGAYHALGGQDWKGKQIKDQSPGNLALQAILGLGGITSPVDRAKKIKEAFDQGQPWQGVSPIKTIKNSKSKKGSSKKSYSPYSTSGSGSGSSGGYNPYAR